MIKTWVQTKFKQSGRWQHSNEGDFYQSTGLHFDDKRAIIRPLPAIVSYGDLPASFSPYVIYGGVIDESLYVLGENEASPYLTHVRWYLYNSVTGMWELDAAEDLAGVTYVSFDPSNNQPLEVIKGNVFYIAKAMILRTDSELSGADEFYNPGSYMIGLASYSNVLFAYDSSGRIYRANTDSTSMAVYLDTRGISFGPDIIFMAPFHQYIAVIAIDYQGAIKAYRLQDFYGQKLHEIASYPITPNGGAATAVIHNNNIYILVPCRITTTNYQYSVFSFDGKDINLVATLATSNDGYSNAKILSWRGELVLCAGDTLYLLSGGQFIQYQNLGSANPESVRIFTAANALAIYGNNPAGTATQLWITDDGLALDGEIITSWLDMDATGISKFLHNLTTVIDSPSTSSHTATIYYRTDYQETWQTAVTGGGHLISSPQLKVNFYAIQIKVALADAENTEIGIASISATYGLPTT